MDVSFLDADTHVDETEETWSYIPTSLDEFRPRSLQFTAEEMPPWLSSARSSGSGYYRFWFINGEFFPRRIRSDERTGTTRETRELIDVPARLRDMDALGVEQQVIYPTVLLDEVSRRPEVQTAVYHSYNMWLADRCAEANGRLQWVAMIPFRSMESAVDEIAFAKERGACGIFKLGIECERAAGDDYFYPAYRQAAECDLPICVHQGNAWSPAVVPLARAPLGGDPGPIWSVVLACSSLLGVRVYQKIPNLRFAFVEADAAWLPYVFALAGWSATSGWSGESLSLADLGFYISLDTTEDIPYLLEVAGGDSNFVVGSDYTHGDRASVIDAHQRILRRQDLDRKSALKITNDNARMLYNL